MILYRLKAGYPPHRETSGSASGGARHSGELAISWIYDDRHNASAVKDISGLGGAF